MSEQEKVNAALNVMRRLPPAHVEMNLSGLVNLMPELTDELLQRVDQPLEVMTDPETNEKYLKCDYNRDGDSYRSPWSNKYYPELDDGFLPSDSLREMEVKANRVFDSYRQLYYEGGVSSVYMWDLDDGFAACFLIKKDVNEKKRSVSKGCWDSIHVVEVKEPSQGMASYKLTTTVMLSLVVPQAGAGDVNLAGGLTRQASKSCKLDKFNTHIVNMGKMVEEMEINLRKSLDELYIQRTRMIVNSIRKPYSGSAGPSKTFLADLSSAVGKKGLIENRKKN